MNKLQHRLFTACLAVFSCGISSMSQALIIDFEDLPAGSCIDLGTSATSGGFTFSSGPGNNLFACDALANGGNTTRALIDANGPALITMDLGGSSFGVAGFDAGSRSSDFTGGIGQTFQSSIALLVTGFLTAGGTVSQQFDFNGTDFESWSLSAAFGSLTSITFTGIGNQTFTDPEFLIDNIVTSDVGAPIPVPPTVALLGLGLLGLRLSRKA